VAKQNSIILTERGLVGKFLGLWPSPRVVLEWISKNWNDQDPLDFYCGKGFYVFIFKTIEDRDHIFIYGPYFLGSRGMFLSHWTLDFNPDMEISSAPVWIRLPCLPLIFWGEVTFKAIGNKLGRFITHFEPKGNIYTCARICVDMEFSKGFPEAIQLNVDGWSHLQALDYEQVPFKCNSCHEYGHFTKICPKAKESQPLLNNVDQGFKQVSRKHKNNSPGGLNLITGLKLAHLFPPIIDLKLWNLKMKNQRTLWRKILITEQI
jgi:hypothetical protein